MATLPSNDAMDAEKPGFPGLVLVSDGIFNNIGR